MYSDVQMCGADLAVAACLGNRLSLASDQRPELIEDLVDDLGSRCSRTNHRGQS